MTSMKVGSYSVGIIRRSKELISRFVTMIPEGDSDLDSFVIYFIPDQDSAGYEENRTLVGYLPPEDFRDVYHILQTERPVYVNWSTEGGKEVDYLSIGTRQEPLGEGFSDRSR